MRVVSIDPGKHHYGVAVWQDSRLVRAELVVDMQRFAMITPADEIVIERPRRQSPQVRVNDLLDLSVAAGEAVGYMMSLSGATARHYVTAKTWKGSLPKTETTKRVLRELDEGEKSCIHKTGKLTLDHNIYDGIGIGLVFLKRYITRQAA